MRVPAAPQVTMAASVALAVAAVAVLAFTALADYGGGGGQRAATPTAQPTPEPASTLPGSVEVPGTEPAKPRIAASYSRRWLKALAGKWARDASNYFQFRSDGSGEWVAYGQPLWTGQATPRDARTFDLSDPSGQGPSYWRVTLVGGGKKLLFAGTQETYRKA
jgi:hypothetical protein